jgi:LacI family transcriptional regulator
VGDHLAEHGLTEWVLLAYPHRWSTRIEREQALRAAAARHRARLTVLECDNNPDSARAVLDSYLAERMPSSQFALVTGNNPLLHGALTALRSRGLRVPDDVSLVAFDEFPWAPLLDPPLTVVDEDSRSIGELAAATLATIIARNAEAQAPSGVDYHEEDTKEVTAQLLIRQSCGCR